MTIQTSRDYLLWMIRVHWMHTLQYGVFVYPKYTCDCRKSANKTWSRFHNQDAIVFELQLPWCVWYKGVSCYRHSCPKPRCHWVSSNSYPVIIPWLSYLDLHLLPNVHWHASPQSSKGHCERSFSSHTVSLDSSYPISKRDESKWSLFLCECITWMMPASKAAANSWWIKGLNWTSRTDSDLPSKR